MICLSLTCRYHTYVVKTWFFSSCCGIQEDIQRKHFSILYTVICQSIVICVILHNNDLNDMNCLSVNQTQWTFFIENVIKNLKWFMWLLHLLILNSCPWRGSTVSRSVCLHISKWMCLIKLPLGPGSIPAKEDILYNSSS